MCYQSFWKPRAALAALLVLGTGCESDSDGPSKRGTRPEAVAIDAARVSIGFVHGQVRDTVALPAFDIARYPVTVGAYRACVAAGACKAARETKCGPHAPSPADVLRSAEVDEAPLTCAGVSQAEAYCKWVGGALPSLAEWLLAARGSEPQRFAWGNTAPDCTQHAFGAPAEGAECEAAPEREAAPIGRHLAGASAFGVEDVLLTSGELLRSSPRSAFSACGTGYRACVVGGLGPGAIDSLEPVLKTPDKSEYVQTAYGFRCAWSSKEL